MPQSLRIKLLTHLLYLEEGELVGVVRGNESEVAEGEELPTLHILLKPGHYDILYTDKQTEQDRIHLQTCQWVSEYKSKMSEPKIFGFIRESTGSADGGIGIEKCRNCDEMFGVRDMIRLVC